MDNIKEQFARLYMELDLTDDQAAMIKKLQRDVDAALGLAHVGRSYSFVEPKFFVDDKVWFKDNKGFEMGGKIVGVETHWSMKNESYHIYSLYKEGRKRLMHVGERNIIYRYDL